MQRNVAAVVDPGAVYALLFVARQNFLGHRTRHRSHRRDEARTVGTAGGPHAARHHALQRAALTHRRPQAREFTHQLLQQPFKTLPGALVRVGHGVVRPFGLKDEVHRAMLEVPAAVGKEFAASVHSAAHSA